MAIQFSDTTTKDGILQRIEQELGFVDGHITGDTDRLKFWTGSINLALDKVFHIIFRADGRWQFDDNNHTTYPILTGDVVANQRDYSFTTDSDSNVILDIQRVFYRQSTSSPYYEIYPVDVQSARESEISSFVDGTGVVAHPNSYDKTATGIFFDTLPPSNVTAGIKIYVNREGSYFTTADTTKMPGFAGLYHEYLVLEPCYRFARANNLQNKETLKRDLMELEKNIEEFYSKRDRHSRSIMTSKITPFK